MGLASVAGTRRAWAEPLQSVQRRSLALGSEVSVLVLHKDKAAAEKAVAAGFEQLETIEKVMSVYRADSQLCRLNRDGKLEQPHALLVEVLRAAQTMSERSGGAFDVTVQPLWELFSNAQKKGGLPCAEEIVKTRALVGWRKLNVSAERIGLEKGMAATLNGIAQGFALDKVAAVLREHGIEHALINTGELGAMGKKEDGQFFRAGIQHPRKPDAFAATVDFDGRCLSTSGDYATHFSADFLHNHIFDPATGDSPLEFSSVSVMSPSGTDADALSTAFFVLGTERGLKVLESYPKSDVFLIRKDGSTQMTKGFPRADV